MQRRLARRPAPAGSRTGAKSPSLARSCAAAPAERTIWPPLPGTSSMVWMVVPSGMLASRRAVPTRAPAPGPPAPHAPPVAAGEAALRVATAAALLRLEERLVGLIGGDLLERRAGHEPPARRGRLVTAERHATPPPRSRSCRRGARWRRPCARGQ